ncbi:SPX domain-containing protein [Scheffersomyces xylosifermentans]|uniref:SPX domain-containing protein n=1 Tax=Scheffersomyces xylosifermentans TaxID=1304137 RepID=UPI00315C63EB
MKFAKVLEQTLLEEDIPEEWMEAAIQYKALKKCINKVVNELKFLGLEKNTLKLLFEDSNSSKVVEVDEHEATASNPVIAEYTLTKSLEDHHDIKPMLKITLDYSNDNFTDDHINELGMQLKARIESLLESDEPLQHMTPKPSRSMPIQRSLSPESSDSDTEKIIELSEENDEIIVISPTVSATNSREGSPPLEGEPAGKSTSLDGQLMSPNSSHDSRKKKNEIYILLNSDTKFFHMLDDELENLDNLTSTEESKIIGEVQDISEVVAALSKTSSKFKNSDMYKWRELFRIYLDSEVFFKYNETSMLSSQRNGAQVKRNLEQFLQNVEKSGILVEFKNKKSLNAFNQFVSLNYHLLKILQFQYINTEAFRKILKKFDKQTSLGISNKFPQLISNDHIFITGTSIAQSICFIIQNRILTLIPQLDDYTCPICMSIAYKPIRLTCGHLFCVRCLVKLKKQNKVNCPICRNENAIAEADGSNLDLEAMQLMKKYFPVEVKEKLKERDKEHYEEVVGPRGNHDKCIIM